MVRIRNVTALLSLLVLAGFSRTATAQAVPVAVDVAGNTATVQVGSPGQPLADLTLTFDDASGLTPASLGVSANLVNLNDPALLSRLPDLSLTPLDSALPLLITIEPPAMGGLAFRRTVRVEVHTHALNYTLGSSYRLLKAPLNGQFRDITDEIASGSVRARGTTGGFSQFLIATDLRETDVVVAGKLAWLRARVDALPAGEQPAFDAWLDAAEAGIASGDFASAITAIDGFHARAAARAGTALADLWRATRDADNQAGDLMAGAATLKFSVAYLRDYGQ